MAEFHEFNSPAMWKHDDGDGSVTVVMKDGESTTNQAVLWLLVTSIVDLLITALDNEDTDE